MARKTNKTDHVLNLLSSGKKTGKEENDAPPVDLRRKAPEPPEEEFSEEEFSEEGLPEPRMTQQEEPLPEPRMSENRGEEPLPEPKVSAGGEDIQPSLVGLAAAAPSVSVVHTSDGEDSIAEAVKESLEAEFDEFLRERNEPKESKGINVFELLGADAEEDGEPEEAPEAQAEPAAEPESIAEPEAEITHAQEPKTQIAPAVAPETQTEPAAESEPQAAEDIRASEPAIPARSESVGDVSADKAPEAAEEILEEQEMAAPAEQTAEEQPQSRTEGNSEPEPVSVPAEAAAAEIIQEETQQEAPEEQPEAAAAWQKEEDMEQAKEEEKDYTMVNVMEYLVRDQVPKYVRQFGHCDCDRCLEDTIALTLTHLPSKYVVVNKNAVSPLLNFYEKKYAGQLIVEITKATMIVNESPHH